LTRTITILVLACFLVVGAAAASILARDSVPTVSSSDPSSVTATAQNPVSNKEGKKDKLAFAVASLPPQQPTQDQTTAALSEPLRQAFASESAVDAPVPNVAAAPVVIPPMQVQKPKVAAKPAVQKPYALLSDPQIAAIKGRLNLSPGQEQLWPAVEVALRAVARKIHERRQANPNAAGAPIDPDSEEVSQLKSAAMPLLFQLREDQKREVRSLARVIGLEAVASRI
jgi:hypothetical protein